MCSKDIHRRGVSTHHQEISDTEDDISYLRRLGVF